MSEPTRVVVIGAGPGGYAAAFHAADLGLRVSLVDEAPRPGGVCLHRGCMPSKALLHVARVLGEARGASAWGVAFGEPRIDLARLRAWKDGVVDTLTGGLAQLSRQRAVDYVQGRAALVDPHTIRVDRPDGATDTLAFDFAVLATGSRPARPPALAGGGERVLDSTAALELRRVPRTLLVVGGGYIGLELGTVYAALGSAVTVVEMTSGLLPGVDRDLVTVLARRLRECTAAIHLGTKVAALNPLEDGVEVVLEGPGVDDAAPGVRHRPGGGRARAEFAHRRARAHGGRPRRAGLRAGRRPAPDSRAVVVRHRRPDGRTAARAQGDS